MRTIYIVCGRICSGKNHYYQTNFDTTTFSQIVVSDVVRSLIGKMDRASLQDTAYLDFEIVKKLTELIEDRQQVVVDGIRQPQIIRWLNAIFDEDTIIPVWIDVPTEERKRRFESREDHKDKKTSFEDSEKRDDLLGLQEVEQMFKRTPYTKFIKPFEKLKPLKKQ